MKGVKIVATVFLVYLGIVAAFESFFGASQRQNASTIVITTTDEQGIAQDRVVSPLEFAHVVGIFNYLTRLADGLGLQLDAGTAAASLSGKALRRPGG